MAYTSSDVRTTGTSRRVSTETKSAFKTTEMIAYVAVVVAIIVTAIVLKKGDNGGDPFRAIDALRYITFLTIGYMVARGLAKSGSRDPYDDNVRTHD